MANMWLRLWHDMPTDPKWKTIARVSGQPITLVQAMYLHLLVDASRNVTRGHATVTDEDLASALDVTEDSVRAVRGAMQGRVLDGDYLSGWDKRQVKKEEPSSEESAAKSAAQRKREQREREKLSQRVTQSHEESRDVTPDKEERREEEKNADADASALFAGRSKRSTGTTLKTYLDDRKSQGLPPFDDNTAISRYATEINLPDEFLQLAWREFRIRHTEEKNAAKKQRDWPATFLNCLKDNWYKLWWHNGEQFELTTQGRQAQLAAQAAKAQRAA